MNPQEHVITLLVMAMAGESDDELSVSHDWKCACGISGHGFADERGAAADAKLHQMTVLATALAGLVKEYQSDIYFSCTDAELRAGNVQFQNVTVALDAARAAGLEV